MSVHHYSEHTSAPASAYAVATAKPIPRAPPVEILRSIIKGRSLVKRLAYPLLRRPCWSGRTTFGRGLRRVCVEPF